MTYLFLFLLSASLSVSATECTIELFSKIYRIHEAQTLQTRDVIKNSNCSPEINNKISAIISNSEGTVGADFLKAELQKDFSDSLINFPYKKLSLLNLNEVLKNQLLPENNLYFTQARSLNGINSLGLAADEQLLAICDSCHTFGEKNIKVVINNALASTSRTVWFSTKIMAKIKVVKASRSLSFQQKNLEPKDFYFDEIMTMSPDNVLTTLENIHFFKSNKTIMQNSVVLNTDLQAVNLINYGTPASVTLLNHNIALQKTAMPLRSARFGETVELKGPNNKNIIGKVIDYNKVVIEL